MEKPTNTHNHNPNSVESEKVDHKIFGGHVAERKELQLTFDPLAETIALRIQHVTLEHSNEIRERLEEIPQYEVPYNNLYRYLPPGFFEGTVPMLPDWTSFMQESAQFIELTDDEILDEMDDEDYPGPLSDAIARYTDYIHENGSEHEKRILNYLLNQLKETNYQSFDGFVAMTESFDPGNWSEYENSYKQVRDDGQEEYFYELIKMRARNAKNTYGAPAKYKKFIMTHSDGVANPMFNNIVAPVGVYGEEFAKKLSQATLFIMEATENIADREINDATMAHLNVLRSHTARGSDEPEGPNSRSTKSTLQEGVLSIMQTISMLTADRVAGYDDPQRLLQELVSQGLVEKVTRMVPLGLVAPIALNSDYFPNPLKSDSYGKLELSKEFSQWLNDSHAEYWQDLAKHGNLSAQSGYGLTCPSSGKRGGIRSLSDTLAHVYDSVAA